MEKKQKKKSKFTIAAFFFSLTIFAFALIALIYIFIGDYLEELDRQKLLEQISSSQSQTSSQSQSQSQEQSQEPEEKEILAEYTTLHALNSDFVGWIKIDDTSVNYPVMQSVYDPTFYLKKDFEKEPARAGLPFLDYRCTMDPRSTNLIIYAHNTNIGTLFSDLMSYEKKEFWQDHAYIQLNTLYEKETYYIFAVFEIRDNEDSEDTFRYYNFINTDSETDFNEYIDTIKKYALYDTGATAAFGDDLLILSTCNLHTWDGRLAVVAKKIS